LKARSRQEIGLHIASLLGNRSQRDLARAVHMHPSAISRVIHGQRTLALGEVVAIAEFLRVSPESIISQDEHAFALRTTTSEPSVQEAVEACSRLIDAYLLFEATAR
jgi:plasmid maintenance system antidote protein VapI